MTKPITYGDLKDRLGPVRQFLERLGRCDPLEPVPGEVLGALEPFLTAEFGGLGPFLCAGMCGDVAHGR